ncbi:hypothetical protein BHM03_00049039, partial [Ensete ventricosum]
WPPARGRPTMAKAFCKGAIGCSQGPLQGGGWMLPGPTRKGSSPQVAARWGSNRPRAQPLAARRRKERPLATNRQGATLAARGAASRGNSVGRKSDVDRRSGCQRARAGAAYAGAATVA